MGVAVELSADDRAGKAEPEIANEPEAPAFLGNHQPGEAAAYDDSVTFVGQLWRPDWKNRVLYLPPRGDLSQWLTTLNDEKVRWLAVGRGAHDQRLAQSGWRPLYPCPDEGCVVWLSPQSALMEKLKQGPGSPPPAR